MADEFWANDEHVPTNDIILSIDDEDAGDPDIWPEHTELVLSAWGKLTDINAQTPHIHRLIAEATFRQTPMILCWTDTFAYGGDNLFKLLRRSILNAASSLGYKSIQSRIRSDSSYANILAATVCVQHWSL